MRSNRPPQPLLLCYSSSLTLATSHGALGGSGLNAFPESLQQVFQAWTDAMRKWPAKILLWGGLCAAAAVAVGVGLSVQQRSPGTVKSLEGRTELVRALGAQGQIEGRLTGGFGHDENRLSRTTVWPRGASEEMRGAIQEGDAASSPETLSNRGVVELFNKKWNEAIDHLEEAAARSPGDAKISSDLAAAYLERGRQTGRAY